MDACMLLLNIEDYLAFLDESGEAMADVADEYGMAPGLQYVFITPNGEITPYSCVVESYLIMSPSFLVLLPNPQSQWSRKKPVCQLFVFTGAYLEIGVMQMKMYLPLGRIKTGI